VYQFEVVRSLVTSKTGTIAKNTIVNNLLTKCELTPTALRSHCVWKVLSKKGIISLDSDKEFVTLTGYNELTESEKNDIRNQANKARRAWEAKQ
jgi:hypothetical protein